MRFFYFCSILVVLIRIGVAQNISPMPPRLSTDQIQKIEQLADVCHIDRAVVLERYRTLFGQDYLKAWRAADFFEEAKAYEILALAIPTLGKAVKGEAINAVLKKRDFSSSTCQVLLAQLEQLIASQTQDDEVTSGYEVTERRIARSGVQGVYQARKREGSDNAKQLAILGSSSPPNIQQLILAVDRARPPSA